MVNINDLKNENNGINDLINVLRHLINDEDLRDNPVFCDLMGKFSNSVETHLSHEDRSIYSELLTNKDDHIHEVANQFLTNTNELRRQMKGFIKRWCNQKNNNSEHSEFVKNTHEIFQLVNERIELETSKLFPIIDTM